MHAKLIKRLEKEWSNNPTLQMRLAILKLYAQYCDEEKVSKLKKFAEYFDEETLLNATIPELERITTTLRYVRRRIAVLGPQDTGDGGALDNALSAPDKRRAARTLAHPMVRGLTNHYLESDSGADSSDEFRDDLLDS